MLAFTISLTKISKYLGQVLAGGDAFSVHVNDATVTLTAVDSRDTALSGPNARAALGAATKSRA